MFIFLYYNYKFRLLNGQFIRLIQEGQLPTNLRCPNYARIANASVCHLPFLRLLSFELADLHLRWVYAFSKLLQCEETTGLNQHAEYRKLLTVIKVCPQHPSFSNSIAHGGISCSDQLAGIREHDITSILPIRCSFGH